MCLEASQFAQAQELGKHALDYTYAEGSPEYWRNTHSTRPGNFVFRRDPNIWVYTPEIANRVGMPLEWASDELKGVAAAAFRMERDGAEEDCGWGGNPKACKPVVRCVLELYFDRQTQPLPWAKDSLILDVARGSDGSSGQHFSPVGRFSKDDPMPRMGLTRQPFADPQTGEELIFANSHSNAGWGVLAYDREIHGRYAFVRLDDGCGRPERDFSKGQVLQLRPGKRFGEVSKKVFHEVTLPASWTKRIRELTDKKWQQDNDFYKNTWNNINQGDKK
ncbi:MAG: hypothetical protein RLZZ498_480 [Pseudomonadota bacterium]